MVARFDDISNRTMSIKLDIQPQDEIFKCKIEEAKKAEKIRAHEDELVD
jgi:hypothetical protein